MPRLSILLLLGVVSAADAGVHAPVRARWKGHIQAVRSVAFTPDGKKILSASDDQTYKLWDIATGEVLTSWRGDAGEMGAAVITPDGKRAISGGEEYSLRVWDLATGKQTAEMTGDEEGIRTLALSPDGRTVAAVSFNGGLYLWDIVTQKRLAVLQQEGGDFVVPGAEPAQAMCAAFTPDGKKLLIGEYDYNMRLWDVAARKEIRHWPGHANPVVLTVAVSPDGTMGLSGGRDNDLHLWDLATSQRIGIWKGHKSFVESVAFSPDGQRAVSGSADYMIKLWDVRSGRELATWQGHGGSVRTVAFSPDGKLVASGSSDYTVMLWDAGPAAAGTPPPVKPWDGALPPGEGGLQARLGKVLFFDRRLSGDETLSCASCHQPARAYTDGKPLTMGYPDSLHFRNTPTLLNAAKSKFLYWDGRFSGEEIASVVRDHISEAHFMNADGRLIVERLRQAPGYVKMFGEVFKEEPTYGRILDALSAFLGTLASAESPYDRFAKGDKTALDPEARRGYELFLGKGGCAKCHPGPRFTDGAFHDRRVPENPDIFDEPFRQISFRRFFKVLGVVDFARLRQDLGLYAVTKAEGDRGKFRTPSLREVEWTAPYMHNGMFATIHEAVRHENRSLKKREVADIVSFLRALTSEPPAVHAPQELPTYELFARNEVWEPPPVPPSAEVLPAVSSFPKITQLPDVPIPADNPVTPEKVILGTRLFCEPLLSGNGNNYCSHCHMPYQGWGDLSDISQGHSGSMHWRNSQTLFNSAYYSKLNWDGSATSLEEQARKAILSGISGNGDPAMIEERLAQSPDYLKLFKKAFGVDRPHFEGVVQALATFERTTTLSRDVPFDRYVQGEETAISSSAVRGFALFSGKAGCIRCHNGPLVSDQSFHATGVPRNPAFDTVPHRQIAVRFEHVVRGVPEDVYRQADTDPGLYLSTLRKEDTGKFRTPSLRELKHTAPYMHNGIFATLREVVDFYDGGGGPAEHKTQLVRPLGLDPEEKKDLIAFLESLSMEIEPRR